MTPNELLQIMPIAEKLKNATRHCFTSTGRHESVAEHSWRISLMAMLLTPEFPDTDMNKVIRMCLIHDLGEAFTGDIPTFIKNTSDEVTEENILNQWVGTLPEATRDEFQDLLAEMKALQTQEAKIYKALDKIEAVIQHNESDITTWLPLEYDLQLTYGKAEMEFSPFFQVLREQVNQWTMEKIEKSKT